MKVRLHKKVDDDDVWELLEYVSSFLSYQSLITVW